MKNEVIKVYSSIWGFSENGQADINTQSYKSKLNGDTKHVQTGGLVSFIYRLSQNRTSHQFETFSFYGYKLKVQSVQNDHWNTTNRLGLLFYFTKNCLNEIFLV